MMSSREFNAKFLLLTKINKEHRSHLLLQMSVKAVSKAEDQQSFPKKNMMAATTPPYSSYTRWRDTRDQAVLHRILLRYRWPNGPTASAWLDLQLWSRSSRETKIQVPHRQG